MNGGRREDQYIGFWASFVLQYTWLEKPVLARFLAITFCKQDIMKANEDKILPFSSMNLQLQI